jgi:hypothetical protein
MRRRTCSLTAVRDFKLISRTIWKFDGLQKIHSLTVRPLKSADSENLKLRGTEFVKYTGAHFLDYHDLMFTSGSFGETVKHRVRASSSKSLILYI